MRNRGYGKIIWEALKTEKKKWMDGTEVYQRMARLVRGLGKQGKKGKRESRKCLYIYLYTHIYVHKSLLVM